MKLKAFAGAVSITLLLAVLAGCGGGGDEKTVSKGEFIVQGNAACFKATKAQSAAIEKAAQEALEEESTGGQVNVQRREEVVGALAASLRTLGSELSDIGAPSGDEQQVEEIAKLYEEAADEAEERPQAFFSGLVLRQPDAAAKAYGLTKCSTM